jgi:hypothetical protein
LLLRSAPSLKNELQNDFTEEEFTSIALPAVSSKQKINSKLLLLLLEAYARTGTTYVPELPLEIALIEHLAITEK